MRVDQAIVSFVTIRCSQLYGTAWLWRNQTQTEQTGKQTLNGFCMFLKNNHVVD